MLSKHFWTDTKLLIDNAGIYVIIQDNKLTINCYINNFKIVAIDSNPLPATKRIGMVCKAGNVYFDYVYGINLTEPEYSNENLFNVYEGHYPKILTSLSSFLQFFLGLNIIFGSFSHGC